MRCFCVISECAVTPAFSNAQIATCYYRLDKLQEAADVLARTDGSSSAGEKTEREHKEIFHAPAGYLNGCVSLLLAQQALRSFQAKMNSRKEQGGPAEGVAATGVGKSAGKRRDRADGTISTNGAERLEEIRGLLKRSMASYQRCEKGHYRASASMQALAQANVLLGHLCQLEHDSSQGDWADGGNGAVEDKGIMTGKPGDRSSAGSVRWESLRLLESSVRKLDDDEDPQPFMIVNIARIYGAIGNAAMELRMTQSALRCSAGGEIGTNSVTAPSPGAVLEVEVPTRIALHPLGTGVGGTRDSRLAALRSKDSGDKPGCSASFDGMTIVDGLRLRQVTSLAVDSSFPFLHVLSEITTVTSLALVSCFLTAVYPALPHVTADFSLSETQLTLSTELRRN